MEERSGADFLDAGSEYHPNFGFRFLFVDFYIYLSILDDAISF